MQCEKCEWYRYPILTDNRLNTASIPVVITETRRCEKGWCDQENTECQNDTPQNQ